MTKEDEKYLNNLLTKIVDTKQPQVIPEVKYTPAKTEDPQPKFHDVVIKKEIDELLPDLDGYDI